MSFIDQKRFVATAEDLRRPWLGKRDGSLFRCYLCGHRFKEGDGVRWIYIAGGAHFHMEDGRKFGVSNFMVCDTCDTPDALEQWVQRHRDFYGPKFWKLTHNLRDH